MDEYILLKTLHILSATLIMGAGIGSAFLMFLANRRGDVAQIAFATKHVVLADWLFTTPSVVFQFLSGWRLMSIAGYSFSDGWIALAVALYLFVGICWLPVVWIQIRMRDIAKFAYNSGTDLPNSYWKLDRWWIILGSLAFPAVTVIFWLMVARP